MPIPLGGFASARDFYAVQSAIRKKKALTAVKVTSLFHTAVFCCFLTEIVCNFANSIIEAACVEAMSETFSNKNPAQ